MALETLRYRLTGLAPMIMHSGRLADPLFEGTKALKAVSGKKKKTDVEYEELARLEFIYSLYLNGEGHPYIPGNNLSALIEEGARKSKDGRIAKAAAFAGDGSLIYKGPQTVEGLWGNDEFRLTVGVRVQQARVMRTRPVFKQWACEFEVSYESEIANPEQITGWLIAAGSMIGLGDWRPRYGRFSVKKL